MELSGRPTHGASVAPDGRALAHVVDVDGYPRAVQRFLEGARAGTWRPVRLPVDGPVTRVRHSPDGLWLACQVAPYGGDRSQVWVVTTDPGDPQAWRADDDRDGSAELVGWDGTRIQVTAELEDGSGESRLVDPQTLGVEVVDRRPEGRFVDSWGGASLVRVGGRGDRSLRLLWGGEDTALLRPDPGSVTDAAAILDDHRPRRLPSRSGWSERLPPHTSCPSESREGYLRVVVRTDVGGDRQRLALLTVTGRGVSERVLMARPDADVEEFCVSEDGTRAAVLWNVDGGRSELALVELVDGTVHEAIPLPGWVATEPSLSADGSILALTVESPDRDRCVEILDLRTRSWVSQAWVDVDGATRDPQAVLPELLRTTTRDGTEVSSWWHPAQDRPVDGGGPVVIHLHGGPEGQERPGWSHLYPVLLRAGISVCAPNVRGSGGFGRAYSHADDVGLRWRGVDDVEDVVADLVARGLADPDRVACVGWSYGGYLTLSCLAARPGLFAAGASIAGMSDLGTFYATTEPWIARAALPKYGHPVHDAELLRTISPLRLADRIDAPVLLVHGAHDTNVPPSESQQLAEAVQAAGGTARCEIVPDEGHEIVQPARRRAAAELVREWTLAAFAAAVSPAGARSRTGRRTGPGHPAPPG